MLTEAEMLAVIEKRMKESATQKALADEIGVSPQYINDVIRGRREISNELAKKFGFRRRVVFEVAN